MTETTIKAVRLETQDTADLSFELARTLYACAEQTGYRVEFLSVTEDTQQANLLCAPESVSASPPGTVPPVIQTLNKLARTHLPETVDTEIVTVDLTPIGSAAVPVERLLNLTRKDQSVEFSDDFMDRLLVALFKRLNPHLVQLVVAPPTDEVVVALRVCEIRPETRLLTRDDDAAARYHNTRFPLSDVLDSPTLTTNRDLFTVTPWSVTLEDRLPGPEQPVFGLGSNPSRSVLAMQSGYDVAHSPSEYERFFERAPELSLQPLYRQYPAVPGVAIDSEQLPALCSLCSRSYPGPLWNSFAGRDSPFIGPVDAAVVTRQSPAVARAKQLCEDADVDTDRSFVRQTLQWLLEQGDRIQPLSVSKVWVPTFERVLPNDAAELLLIVSDPVYSRAEIISAVQATPSYADGLTVMTASIEDGKQAARLLLEPVKGPVATSSPAIELYTHRHALIGTQGYAVRPKESPPVQWAVRPGCDGEICAIQDGVVIESWPRTASIKTLADSFNQLFVIEDRFVLTDPAGTHLCSYSSKADMNAEVEPVCEPAFPSTLADGLEFATVFARRGSQFSEVRLKASWDRHVEMFQERLAELVFLDQFTVPDAGSRLPLEELIPQFASWYRYQTDDIISVGIEGAIRSVYNQCIATDHILSSDETALPDRTWIYHPFSDDRVE